MKNVFHTFKILVCLFRRHWIWQWESGIKKVKWETFCIALVTTQALKKSIMRISDLLSLLSQKLNLENNRASCKDGVGGREAFCILPWIHPFFTCSPLCLREQDIDSRGDKDKISQSSSLFFWREEVTLVSNLMLLAGSPPPPPCCLRSHRVSCGLHLH